jgi:hypothetical protein
MDKTFEHQMSLHVKCNNGIKIYLDFSVFCSMVLHQLQGDSSSSGSAEVLILSPKSDYAGKSRTI